MADLFHHLSLETELRLHLHWATDRVSRNGSAIGLGLADSLKEFGLVINGLIIIFTCYVMYHFSLARSLRSLEFTESTEIILFDCR